MRGRAPSSEDTGPVPLIPTPALLFGTAPGVRATGQHGMWGSEGTLVLSPGR